MRCPRPSSGAPEQLIVQPGAVFLIYLIASYPITAT
jgi:hypothetical protein